MPDKRSNNRRRAAEAGCCGGLTPRSFLQAWEQDGDLHVATVRLAIFFLFLSVVGLIATVALNVKHASHGTLLMVLGVAAAVFACYLWLLLAAACRSVVMLKVKSKMRKKKKKPNQYRLRELSDGLL